MVTTDKTNLISKVEKYLSSEDLEKIRQSLEFAIESHKDQKRKTGEPYIIHPINTAIYLAEMKMDWPTISAALLHDVIEDCQVEYEELEDKFGKEVAALVDGVTKLPTIKITSSTQENLIPDSTSDISRAATIRKLLLSTTEDARVILIKLADRLHNMQTLFALDEKSQSRIALETMEIFAPLAHRLGIWEFKWKLEDEAFKYLLPNSYKKVANLISGKRKERENYAKRATKLLEEALAKSSINCLVEGRAKHLYSIYKKIEKYSILGKKFDEIHDLIAVRIIVNSVQDCYASLGVLHELWRPIPGEFDDYIANPKESMYQSIHSTVMCLDSYPVEIQIRTKEMHEIAERGIAAHWQYKDIPENLDGAYMNKLNWFRNLIDWQIELPEDENYIDSIKTDILKERIYCYTPAGDIKSIPEGSTPIDFAYEVHTELGNNASSALINGQNMPLNSVISNGDTIEIIKSKNQGPKLDWLNPDLGYVSTNKSRFKIRQWFRKEEKTLNIERGIDVISRLVNRLKINTPLEELSNELSYESLDELALLVGSGVINTPTLVKKLSGFLNQQIENITIKIDVADRVGLIRDVTNIISNEGLNITGISTNEIDTGKSIIITVDSNGLEQQNKIYSIIETIDGVDNIETINRNNA
ncbi:MAG: bifunctional (p)ppGpp synthetase/guanosine-3',5'-bis(diphosphate) 3'-pyrophosphohydrolase [SAR202 cluster bacterium]|nr:bifunctional (p)ppGpp synthetase/guanosine-3',5'-bis(diphosphate) 3'-pyrophosphohydrolase [SAR202 cluster bacterium]|tara:strand:- start:7672 stop:9606 length:1935 start_codon:yes stop_codon:yes gene_type:complete